MTLGSLLATQQRQKFRGGLEFKAHRLVYHSTLGWRVIKKKTAATIAFAGTVDPKDVGTNIISRYGFQPQYLPDVREKRKPAAAKW